MSPTSRKLKLTLTGLRQPEGNFERVPLAITAATTPQTPCMGPRANWLLLQFKGQTNVTRMGLFHRQILLRVSKVGVILPIYWGKQKYLECEAQSTEVKCGENQCSNNHIDSIRYKRHIKQIRPRRKTKWWHTFSVDTQASRRVTLHNVH
jgi:hypothetical protein